jgi:uncharacterized protein YciI
MSTAHSPCRSTILLPKEADIMWYVVMSKSIVPRETIQGTEPDNLAWMKSQHDAGKVLFSGPTTEGVGIWILHVGSREEAEALVKTHPWVERGWRECEIYEWRVTQALGVGHFTLDSVRAAR